MIGGFKRIRVRWILSALMVTALPLPAAPPPTSDDLRTLIVGGGPTPHDNQIAIESNVRYVLKLLPQGSQRTVLFADGDRRSKTVVFEERGKELTQAERILELVLHGQADDVRTAERYREPRIPQLDGPAKRSEVAAVFEKLKTASPSPVLLYFTGHGSPEPRQQQWENNRFDLWGEELSVRDLASHVASLPAGKPLTLIMVQCFSGAFGNLLFEGGDPDGNLVDRDIAGFFATVNNRMAAGCSPEVNEAEYRDFTSFFFAALTGRDRVGRPVTGADYNGDGRVGMDEAYCYALANDASIDVPMCTSDVFLRRFVKSDTDLFKTPYNQARDWASPGQRAALESLSTALKLSGEDRGERMYDALFGENSRPRRGRLMSARRNFRRELDSARSALFGRWPELKDPKDTTSRAYVAARAEALQGIRRSEAFQFPELLRTESELGSALEEEYARQLIEARELRFVRLFKTVVLAHRLQDTTDQSIKNRYARLTANEGRSLFSPPITTARNP